MTRRLNSRVSFSSVLPALAFLTLAGCTPMQHTMSPYRDSLDVAQELESRAHAVCVEHRGEDDQPPYGFTTDGCSMWPDGKWGECCVDHDIAYWCGGSACDRERADRQLGECIGDKGSPTLGAFMGMGVRLGGIPWTPFPWRWAYGWDGVFGYDEVSVPPAAND